MTDYTIHPWIDVAVRELGVTEVTGPRTNKRIAEYLKGVGATESDETPWCSAFVNWVLRRAGYASTSRANARSWLKYGEELAAPQYGAVTVFWRGEPTGWQGHVAFFLADAGDYVKVLGGNQQNSVCAALYPRTRVLGYRWPVLMANGQASQS